MQDCTSSKRAEIIIRTTQIPLISNNATTGHKLQGASVDMLYVPSWSYTLNWPYVVLSRVWTLEGLFIGKALNSSKSFEIPEALTRLLHTF